MQSPASHLDELIAFFQFMTVCCSLNSKRTMEQKNLVKTIVSNTKIQDLLTHLMSKPILDKAISDSHKKKIKAMLCHFSVFLG